MLKLGNSGPIQRFFSREAEITLSEQGSFKNKAVAKACCFYRYTFFLHEVRLVHIANEKCMGSVHVHSVSMVIVSLISRASPRDLGHYNYIIDTSYPCIL